MEQNNFKNNWINAWSSSSFRIQSIITLIIIIAIAIFISDFFRYIQLRPASKIGDVILDLITAKNMSVYIFLLIYSLIVITLFKILTYPLILLKGIQAYALLLMIRLICLYLFPLEPHTAIIPLEDPFIGYFFYKETMITKDLFFSGHVSTVFLLCLINPSPSLKYLYYGILFLISGMILVQHVHYTVDVILAPLFAFVCYKLAAFIPLRINTNEVS